MIVQIHFRPPSGNPRFEIRLLESGGVSYNTVEPGLQNLLKQRTKFFDFLRNPHDPETLRKGSLIRSQNYCQKWCLS
jgi:hypothetical protein